jgi:hypothetical protein
LQRRSGILPDAEMTEYAHALAKAAIASPRKKLPNSGKESPIVADGERPVASSDCNHIRSSKMVRRIPER